MEPYPGASLWGACDGTVAERRGEHASMTAATYVWPTITISAVTQPGRIQPDNEILALNMATDSDTIWYLIHSAESDAKWVVSIWQ